LCRQIIDRRFLNRSIGAWGAGQVRSHLERSVEFKIERATVLGSSTDLQQHVRGFPYREVLHNDWSIEHDRAIVQDKMNVPADAKSSSQGRDGQGLSEAGQPEIAADIAPILAANPDLSLDVRSNAARDRWIVPGIRTTKEGQRDHGDRLSNG